MMTDSLLITGITLGYLLVVLAVGLRARRGQGSSLEAMSPGGVTWACWCCSSS